MQKAAIIIVNWNTGKLLAACLRSLEAAQDKGRIARVVIVDNNSSDDSVAKAQAVSVSFPLHIIESEENNGFAKANNMGFAYIRRQQEPLPHILLLNPDTEVPGGSLSALLGALEQHESVGIVGPKLIEPGGAVQPSVRAFPTTAVLAMLFVKLHTLFPKSAIWKQYMMHGFDYTQETEVDQVMGAAFLIRNTVVEELDLLDEDYWIWFEEVDYCKRAKDAGWAVLYTPRATVTHYGGVSFHQLTGLKKSLPFYKSALTYSKKHLGAVPYGMLLSLFILSVPFIPLLAIAHVWVKRQNTSRL